MASEYGLEPGPAGVDERKLPWMLSASEQARLVRNTATESPLMPMSERVWNGESPWKTMRQILGELQKAHGDTL